MTFDEAVAAVDGLVGRNVHVVLYARNAPVASLDGPLGAGVRQDVESGSVITFDVGGATLALSSLQFVDGEHAGTSLQLQLVDGVEVIVFPWREE